MSPENSSSDKASLVANGHFAAIVRSSSDAIASKTTSGVVLSWNAAAERMFGHASDEIIGKSIRVLIPADRQQEEDEILASIALGVEVKNFETIRLRKDGTMFPVSVTVSPIHDAEGRIIAASKIVRDITENVENLRKLRESEDRFRAIADNIAQLAWMTDADGNVTWYNQRWYEYTGLSFEDMNHSEWRSVHHPDHINGVIERISQHWRSGEPWEDIFPLRSASGEYRWFLSRALPIRDHDGAIIRWFGSNTDITEQKEREEFVRLLLAEVNHRSKNMMTLVQAIARQAARPEDKVYVDRLLSRLQSLSASQDALIHSGWRGTDVETLIKFQLAHFGDIIGSRIFLRGPAVALSSSAAQILGMAIHELATNAAKYGSLSNDRGRILIKWRLLDEGEEARFAIEWREENGPEVQPPTINGFGASVLGKIAQVSLHADVNTDYAQSGLIWTLICKDGRALQRDEPGYDIDI